MFNVVVFSEHLNSEFVQFLFNNIENPASGEHEDQLSDLLVNLVLAFNLHFHVPSKNLVLQVMEEKKTVKVFTEKILLLFNRDGMCEVILLLNGDCMFESFDKGSTLAVKYREMVCVKVLTETIHRL